MAFSEPLPPAPVDLRTNSTLEIFGNVSENIKQINPILFSKSGLPSPTYRLIVRHDACYNTNDGISYPALGKTESVSIYRQPGSKHLRNHLDLSAVSSQLRSA